MDKLEEVRDTLAELANQPDIAAFLLERGIRGTMKDPTRCPVYRYLESVGVKVDETGWWSVLFHYGDSDDQLTWNHFTVDTPEPIREFMQRFDGGDFPELVDPEYPVMVP